MPPIDSVDVSGYILGKASTSPRQELVIGAPSGYRDIWGGDHMKTQVNGVIVDEGEAGLWKLLVGAVSMNIWTGPHFPNVTAIWNASNSPEQLFFDCKEACLWRLDHDPTEHVDLAQDPNPNPSPNPNPNPNP